MRSEPLWILPVVLSSAATAGLLNSPPPRLESGEPLQVVYRMGAIYFEPGRVDTVITCVNQGAAPAEVALEVFDPNDAPAGSPARKQVSAGGEVSFVTSAAVGQEGRVVVAELLPLAHGKARVSSNTTRLSCSGFWRARSADGTTKDSPLQLVKKVAAGSK